jgi:D-alanyl-D-alanine carboxypeptidase (penicillin-binding protein 5/6)
MQLIAVVLAAPDPVTRFDGAMKMFDYGYANFALIAKEETGTPMGEIRIYKGALESSPVVIKEQVNMLAPKGKHVSLDGEIIIFDALDAPLAHGTAAGEVIYTWEGEEVGRSQLIIPEDIAKASVFEITERLFRDWFFAR